MLVDAYITELSMSQAFWGKDKAGEKTFDIIGFSRALEAAVTQDVTKAPVVDNPTTLYVSMTLGAKKIELRLPVIEVVNKPLPMFLDRLLKMVQQILPTKA